MGKTKSTVVYLLMIIMLLSGCSIGKPKPTIDPHEGQVYLYDGYDWVWYTPVEGVETNAFSKSDFQFINNQPVYIGSGYTVKKGIDVSEHQKEIDWDRVKTQGFDFCFVRVGRRGYTEGGLFEDSFFEKNIEGAKRCGMELGVYFFSQAITVAEAIEEANWVLEHIGGYNITLPIAFDWEKIDAEEARTADLDITRLTDCAVAFCETIRRAGYTPCVYYNRTTGYYRYDLSRLTNYMVWFALPCSPPDIIHPSFYYKLDMWQYSLTGQIPGIQVETDLDYIFTKNPEPTFTVK
jgi:GH25 family lysozyme M1 (1,4-beta-N-acetylmuramidase)